MTINCPRCGGQTDVKATRGDGSSCYRMRVCRECGAYFYTREAASEDGYEKVNEIYHDQYIKVRC